MSALKKMRAQQLLLDNGGTGRWVISYADFITLLFAFFVVMYSISSVNDGKFRVLSDSMVTVFNAPSHRPVPIGLGGSPEPVDSTTADTLEEAALGQELEFDPDIKPLDLDETVSVRERVERAIAPFLDDADVTVRDGEMWVEVELPSELLFASGRAELSAAAPPFVQRMATALRGIETPIRVEGLTDNVPLRGGRFGSNWQLSAARAAALVDRFTTDGIDPTVMSAIGFGEFHPIASNDSEQGRRRNRRVVVAIAKHSMLALGGPVPEANSGAERLTPQTLQRVTRLPDPLGIL